jgi:hypothetical protein
LYLTEHSTDCTNGVCCFAPGRGNGFAFVCKTLADKPVLVGLQFAYFALYAIVFV